MTGTSNNTAQPTPAPTPEQRLLISHFKGVTDVTAGEAITVSWTKLAKRLTQFQKSPTKKSVKGWSPALYRPMCTCGDDACGKEHGHRKNENVLEVYALGLDLDKRPNPDDPRSPLPLDQAAADAALARLAELGLRHVVHSTYSYAPPTNVNLRAVIAISRPVRAHEWDAFWDAAIRHLGIHVEAACKNLARFWFFPSCPPTMEGWSKSVDGAPLDVDALLATVTAPPASKQPAPRTRPPREAGKEFDRDDFVEFVTRHCPGAKSCDSRTRTRFEIECPWEGEHSSSSPRDTLVSFGDKGPEFSCLHDHCKEIRHWQEFRAHFDPEYAAFRENGFQPLPRASHTPPRRRSEASHLDEETLAIAARDDDPPTHDPHPNAPGDGGPAPWPDPQPLGEHLPPVEPFCVDLLPADLQRWVCDIAYRMSVPVDLPAIATMCAISILATNARTIKPKRYDSWRVYPILWGATIAPPGSKKTPAANEVFRPLESIDIRSRQDFAKLEKERQAREVLADAEEAALKDAIKNHVKGKAKDSTETREELVQQLADHLKKQEDEVPKPRRYLAQDVTIEKLADIVSRGARRRCYPIGVRWDELLGFFRQFERDGHEQDRSFFLSGWSAQTTMIDRIGRGETLCRDLAVIVCGNMTPEPFEEYVREAATGSGADGLLQRFQLMVYPDRMPPTPMVDQARDHLAHARAVQLFERLASLDDEDKDGHPPALQFDAEAQIFYAQWANDLAAELATSTELVAWRSHLAKFASLMPALALICHLASGAGKEHEPVTLWAAEQAAGWCKYLRSHAHRIYSLLGTRDRGAAGVIASLIEGGALSGLMKVREVYRRMRNIDPKEIKAGLELLEDLGWVRLSEERKAAGGRPSEWVSFNPKAAGIRNRAA